MNDFSHEESTVGKVFDARIVARLFTFMKPYVRYLVLAVAFLMCAAGVEILYPYITKVAIDDYIVKNGRKVAGDGDTYGFARIDNTHSFATQQELEKIDARTLHAWEVNGVVSRERYYYFFLTDIDDRARSVVQTHEDLFETRDSLAIVAYSDLHKLSAHEVMLLRGRDISGVLRIAILFLAVLAFGAIANYAQIYFSQYAGQQFMHGIRHTVFVKLQKLHLAFFDRNPVGRLVTRATNDVEAINEAFTQVFTQFFKDILLLVGIIIVMLWINVHLALIAFLVIPVLTIVTFYFRVRARGIYRKVRIRLAQVNATLQENLSGMRVIKIFSQEKENLKQFDEVNLEYLRVNIHQVLLMSFFRPFIEIVSSVGIGLVLYYGGGQVITGKVSLGVLIAFITYVEMFFRPIRELTESYTLLQSAMASSERIFMLLDEPAVVRSRPDARTLHDIRGEIEFRSVWFKYDKDWVLKDVSFTVKPGEHVALVGPTGAGKTSIINLVSRLYDVQKGTILIDGVDIRDIRLEELRSKIGVVPQDVFLFAGDIKSNIRLNRVLEDEQVKEIAAYVNADKFIDRFPHKYDEDVAERGVTFSTGERQLLSFARALAFDPAILVLDEATANIDAETEKTIHEGLERLIIGRTAIIIAHRLSTIKNVDRIYVICNGVIVETGTHEALVAKCGMYYDLYQLQSLRVPTDPAQC
jgi:ATP-binding cassette subfamily B protein/subfamily B ATP-binding cassette protein MsbA